MDACPAPLPAPPSDALVLALAVLAAAAVTLVVLLAPLALAARAAASAQRAPRGRRDPAAAVRAALTDPSLAVTVTSLLVRTGGGGAVFRGCWGGAPVAVFVSRRPADAARTGPPPLPGSGAPHPNTLPLFAVRETAVAGPAAASGALLGTDGAPLSLRGALAAAGAGDDGDAPASSSPSPRPEVETVAVYELCERGSLRDAVRAGRGRGPPSPADEPCRVATLLEVARGLARFHAAGTPHGALCPDNVLLASSDDDGRGWVAKVAPPFAPLPPATRRGARPPHAAPPPSLEADVYAFGVLAWEVLAGTDAGLTPPGAAPGDWPCCEAARALARACLSPDPAARPTARQLVRSLAALADRLRAVTPVSELDYLFAALQPGGVAAAAPAAAPKAASPTPTPAAASATAPAPAVEAPLPAAATGRRPFVEDIFFGLPTPH